MIEGMGFVIYYAKNRNNGKGYVGYTERGIDVRWNEHLGDARVGKGQLLGKAIRKHGAGVFEHTVVEECVDVSMMKLRETHWIRELRTHVSAWGYNLTFGGDGVTGWSPSEEHRRILSERHTGEKNHNFGKAWGKLEWTEEERLKRSKQRTGEGNPMYGRHHKQDALVKIGAATSINKRKRVIQCTKDGVELVCFISLQWAAEHVGGQANKISEVLCGHRRTHKGYIWKYATIGEFPIERN